MFDPDETRLNALEERLRCWEPSAGGLDRDRLLFEAGRAQASGSIATATYSYLWKCATAALLLLAVGLAAAWHRERRQRRVLELDHATLASNTMAHPARLASQPASETAPDPTSYLVLVRQVKNLPDPAFTARPSTGPQAVSDSPSVDSLDARTLRPRDIDRLISL